MPNVAAHTRLPQSLPQVCIVGGGFGGLAAAKALAKAPVHVTLLDRRNHHVFQPLLYQVATAALSPADISAPIRTVLRAQDNCEVALAEVQAVDLPSRRLVLKGGTRTYDYLILAAGATHAYFGHDEWARFAPGLKSIDDATELRRRILLAFETAEYEFSDAARQAVLTFAIVGGGPTGVELAGAIKEIAGKTLPRDYRHIDTRTTRVLLFEAGPRLLDAFAPTLSEWAMHDLERMGVEVRVNSKVTNVTPQGIYIGEEFMPVRTVFWAAGVKASALGKSLAAAGVALDHAGRVVVESGLTVPNHSEVFVIGDMAAAKSADTGNAVPGVAQGAIQMGRFAGTIIAEEVRAITSGKPPPPRGPFIYHDKGSMAVIGKAKAVVQIGKFKRHGFLAWLLWGAVHIAFLIGFRNRWRVLLSWFWNWLINARDARLITGDTTMLISLAQPPAPMQNEPAARHSAQGR
jgi:NADH dehydrogenase